MACFVKLKENMYIQWSKTGDCPVSFVLSKAEVESLLKEEIRVKQLLGQHQNSLDEILEHLENYGTTDLSKSVDLDFILKYNQLGPSNNPLDLNGILKKFGKFK